jgi:hypothetical protein
MIHKSFVTWSSSKFYSISFAYYIATFGLNWYRVIVGSASGRFASSASPRHSLRSEARIQDLLPSAGQKICGIRSDAFVIGV